MTHRAGGFEATRQITMKTPEFVDPIGLDLLTEWREACFGDGKGSREAFLEAAQTSAGATLTFYHLAAGRATESEIETRLVQRPRADMLITPLASNYLSSLRVAIAMGEVVTDGVTTDQGALDKASRPKPSPTSRLGGIAMSVIDGLNVPKRRKESRLVSFAEFIEQNNVDVQELFESAVQLTLQDEDALIAHVTYAGLLDVMYADRQSGVRLPAAALLKGWARRIADMQGIKDHEATRRLEKRRELSGSVMRSLGSALERVQGVDPTLARSMTGIVGDYKEITEGSEIPGRKRKLIGLVEATEGTITTQLLDFLKVGTEVEAETPDESPAPEGPDEESILQEAAVIDATHQDILEDWRVGREHRGAFRSIMEYLVRGGANSENHWAVSGNQNKDLSRQMIGLVNGVIHLLDKRHSVDDSWQALAYSVDSEIALLDRHAAIRQEAQGSGALRARLVAPRERLRGTLEAIAGEGTGMTPGVRKMLEQHWPDGLTASKVNWEDVEAVISKSVDYVRSTSG